MSEDKDSDAVMTLPRAPSERDKAGVRLMQAALLCAMGTLQQGASALAAVAGVNDLSFRRDAGRIDLSAAFEDADGEHATQLLMEAALAFAAADAEAKAAEGVARPATATPLMDIVNAAADRFDQHPEYRASIAARAELQTADGPLLRVVVFEEAARDGRKVWVAQALEIDIATQARPGEDMFAALVALGVAFDNRIRSRAQEPGVAPVPPAPADYESMWEAGVPIGSGQLGATRRAEFRRVDVHGRKL